MKLDQKMVDREQYFDLPLRELKGHLDAGKVSSDGYRVARERLLAPHRSGSGFRQCIIFDAHTAAPPGFGVRLYPSGYKSYVLAYRVKSVRHILKVGKVQGKGAIRLPEARKRALDHYHAATAGDDPLLARKEAERLEQEDRREGKRPKTFGAVCDEFVKRYATTPNIKEATAKEHRRRIKARLRPRFGHLPIETINQAQVSDFFNEVGVDSPVEANRCLVLIARIFSWAVEKGYLPGGHPNPAKRPKRDRFPEKARTTVVKSEEWPKLLNAIGEEPDPYVRAFYELLALTGLRKSELLSAKWNHLDRSSCELELPETKSGTPRRAALLEDAVDTLRKIPRQVGNPYIFPAHRLYHVGRGREKATVRVQPGEKHMVNPRRQWLRIRERAGVPHLRVHDLRRSVAENVIKQLKDPQAAQVILGHATLEMTMAAYRAVVDREKAREGLEAHRKTLRGETS